MQKSAYQMKEQDQIPEENLSEVKRDNLSEKVFRVMIIKMIKVLRGRMDIQHEKLEAFNRVREYKEQSNWDEE